MSATTTLTLTDEQHSALFVAQLHQLRTSMQIASENAHLAGELAAGPMRRGAISDLQTSLRVLREDLDALDALGWPNDPVGPAYDPPETEIPG